MEGLFKHSFNALDQGNLFEIFDEYGAKGYGVYWYLVEQIFANGGQITLNKIEADAEELQVPMEDIMHIIRDYDLFSVTGPFVHLPNKAYSESCAGIEE